MPVPAGTYVVPGYILCRAYSVHSVPGITREGGFEITSIFVRNRSGAPPYIAPPGDVQLAISFVYDDCFIRNEFTVNVTEYYPYTVQLDSD